MLEIGAQRKHQNVNMLEPPRCVQTTERIVNKNYRNEKPQNHCGLRKPENGKTDSSEQPIQRGFLPFIEHSIVTLVHEATWKMHTHVMQDKDVAGCVLQKYIPVQSRIRFHTWIDFWVFLHHPRSYRSGFHLIPNVKLFHLTKHETRIKAQKTIHNVTVSGFLSHFHW